MCVEDTYCNGFDQRFARQQLCKHVPTNSHPTIEGHSSLLSNDSVNILAATNTGKNSEYIVITLLLRNWAVNIPSQQHIKRDDFYAVHAESM
jgi:hypothetical protein